MKKKFNPWPWGLAATLLLFCVVQFSMVALASSGFEGLEDVEYYRHGVEYGKEIDRQIRQRELDWTVSQTLGPSVEPGLYPLHVALLDSDQKAIQHAKLKVKVGRPATIRQDREYTLKEIGPGIYTCEVALSQGSWRFQIEAEKGQDLVKVGFRHTVEESPPQASPAPLGAILP